MQDIKIIDNALPEAFYKHLKNKLWSSQVNWMYTEGTSNSLDEECINSYNTWSLAHLAIADTKYTSPLAETCYNALILALNNLGLEVSIVHRCRIGLIPCFDQKIIHGPHVDQNFPHLTGLLYFNNCNGPTIFYDSIYDHYSDLSTIQYFKSAPTTQIIKEIEPRENRFVLFDGLRYHSSSTATNDKRRTTINFNFEIVRREEN